MKQLIYKQTRAVPFDVLPLAGAGFFCASTPMQLRAIWRPLVGFFGLSRAGKSVLKLVGRRRCFYGVVADGVLIHFGWVSFGFCRFYDVTSDSCVIGPIWSSASSRGQGVATRAMKLVMNRLIASGKHTFYIDTSEDNIACQRAIDKCEFGERINVIEKREGR